MRKLRIRAFTLSDWLTVSRTLFIPVMAVGVIDRLPLLVCLVLSLFVSADVADGVVARHRGQEDARRGFSMP